MIPEALISPGISGEEGISPETTGVLLLVRSARPGTIHRAPSTGPGTGLLRAKCGCPDSFLSESLEGAFQRRRVGIILLRVSYAMISRLIFCSSRHEKRKAQQQHANN